MSLLISFILNEIKNRKRGEVFLRFGDVGTLDSPNIFNGVISLNVFSNTLAFIGITKSMKLMKFLT